MIIMAYNFFFDKIQLPVAPPSIEVTINNQNRTISLINFGEINVLKKSGLKDIEFRILLPRKQYPFAIYPDGFHSAEFFLNAFEEFKNSQEPFRLLISFLKQSGTEIDLTFDYNHLVSMESYKIVEDAEYVFDVEVDIQLKEFRNFGTKRVEIYDPPADAPQDSPAEAVIYEDRPPENPPLTLSHKVVLGDSLWTIARHYLGDGNRWGELMELNPHIAERNLGTGRARYTIFPNQVIIIPNQ